MTIIDHLGLGVPHVPAARVFYSRVLDELGIRCLAEGEGFAADQRDPFRDELPNGEVFYSPREAQLLIERWWRHYT